MSYSTCIKAVDDYVVLDTETTGRSYTYDRITELGAIKVIGGDVVDRFQMLVNPGRRIPQEVVDKTGITNEMVAEAPPYREGVEAFLRFAGGLPVVGHNVTFDAHMLNVDGFDNELIDTMRIGKRFVNGLPNYRLETLFGSCSLFDSPFGVDGHAHRAAYDAEMTRVVYEFLKPDIGNYIEYGYESGGSNQPRYGVRLSEKTKRKAGVLAKVRELALQGISTYEEVEQLYFDIALDDELSGDIVFAQLQDILAQALGDDVLTVEEQTEILEKCKELADPVIRDAGFEIEVPGNKFIISGKFEHGDDASIMAMIEDAGGLAFKKNPCRKEQYVVVGNLGSTSWAYGDYGTKVDKAVTMQAKGGSILIISEDVLFAALEGRQGNGGETLSLWDM